MPLVRAVPLLVLAAGAQPALADTITAETALKRYREQFQPIDQVDCPRGEGIVVCGRRKGELAPAPYARLPGERVRLLPGEPPSARGAQNIDRMCMRNCEPATGSILNVIKGIGALLGRDD